MNRVRSIFSQLLKLFSRNEFEHLVRETRAERHARGFACWDQLVAMLFCQLGRAQSLREICGGLWSCEGKLVHLGICAPARSTQQQAKPGSGQLVASPAVDRPGPSSDTLPDSGVSVSRVAQAKLPPILAERFTTMPSPSRSASIRPPTSTPVAPPAIRGSEPPASNKTSTGPAALRPCDAGRPDLHQSHRAVVALLSGPLPPCPPHVGSMATEHRLPSYIPCHRQLHISDILSRRPDSTLGLSIVVLFS